MLAAAPALVLAGWALSGCATSAQAATPAGCAKATPTLTVTGTGRATGSPDQLTLTITVNVVGPSAQAALAQDNAAAGAVQAALSAGGVAAKQVQTTDLTIQANYNNTGAITGYSVGNTLVAHLRDLATAGQVVDSAAGAGGNATRVEGLSFSMADPRQLQDQARQDAVHQAVSHAGALAAAAGEHLGAVCSISDAPGTAASTTAHVRFAPLNAAAGAASAVPLQTGTQQATARVTVVYALDR